MPTRTNNHSHWYQDLPEAGKRIVHVLAVLFLLGLTLGAFAFAYSYLLSAWVSARTAYSPSQISVSGEGKITLRPDTAVLDASVITQAK